MNPSPFVMPHDPSDTVYRGSIDGYGNPVVTENGRTLSPARSWKIRNHSPDGFNWGYGGSGPAQLALALLLHATRGNAECAQDLYQAFKWQVVSKWDHEGWTITRSTILRWIGEQPGRLEGRGSATEGGESS